MISALLHPHRYGRATDTRLRISRRHDTNCEQPALTKGQSNQTSTIAAVLRFTSTSTRWPSSRTKIPQPPLAARNSVETTAVAVDDASTAHRRADAWHERSKRLDHVEIAFCGLATPCWTPSRPAPFAHTSSPPTRQPPPPFTQSPSEAGVHLHPTRSRPAKPDADTAASASELQRGSPLSTARERRRSVSAHAWSLLKSFSRRADGLNSGRRGARFRALLLGRRVPRRATRDRARAARASACAATPPGAIGSGLRPPCLTRCGLWNGRARG